MLFKIKKIGCSKKKKRKFPSLPWSGQDCLGPLCGTDPEHADVGFLRAPWVLEVGGVQRGGP